jgi:hypothetical protein
MLVALPATDERHYMSPELEESADRPALENLVTPEMLGAGASAYRRWLARKDEIATEVREGTLADEIYLAMERKRLEQEADPVAGPVLRELREHLRQRAR